MITAPQIRSILDGLARRFENRPQEAPEFPSCGAVGWGQFLDGQPKHNQVGPFGTCSGIITRALAGRGQDQLDGHINILIEMWWAERKNSKSHAKFLGQTIRLAMLNLAIRLKQDARLATLERELQETLLADLRRDHMWGNYHMPGNLEDSSPRLIASSLVVLSFMLFRDPSDAPPADILDVIKMIEDRLLGSKNLPKLHVAVASAAVLSLPTYKPASETRKLISNLAYASQISLPELGVYFYDYEYREDNTSSETSNQPPTAENLQDEHVFKTDYFIVPTELVLGIAGYQPNAPRYLRFRAESNLNLLVQNLQGYDGFFRPDNEQRISSVNQGWVALYLGLAERTLNRRGSVVSKGAALIPRLGYELLRVRPDKFWLDSLMLSLCAFFMVVGSVPLYGELTWQSLLSKACVSALAFIAGRLYAPIFVKRLFVER